MMEKETPEIEERAREIIALLQQMGRERRRYRVLLIRVADSPARTFLLRRAAEGMKGRYLDFLAEAFQGELVGAYRWYRFRDWLREEARGTPALLVEGFEALMATWEDREKKEFFRDILRTEVQNPLILASASPFIEVPPAGHGYGVVWIFGEDLSRR